MGNNIRHFRELDVYNLATEATIVIFELMISHPDQWTIKSIRENEADYA